MRYSRKGFDFDNFEITKREILASISIIAVMILFGILISSKISEHQMDKNEIYNKAVKIEVKKCSNMEWTQMLVMRLYMVI